jgi:hypothetical protein
MKRHRGDVVMLLPTDDVMREYQPSELLLQRIGLDLRTLAESVLDHWIQSELRWGQPDHAAVLSCYDVVFSALYPDTLSEEIKCKLDLEDRRALEQLIRKFAAEFYLAVCPILELFKLTERQLTEIRIGWLDTTLALSIPRP